MTKLYFAFPSPNKRGREKHVANPAKYSPCVTWQSDTIKRESPSNKYLVGMETVMAFEEEGGQGNFKPYKQMEVGECVCEGWYKGRRKGKFQIPNFEIKDKDTGALIIANGCGLLERKFRDASIVPGDYIRIEYAGMDKMKKGEWAGTWAHNLKLFRDKSLFDESMGGPVNESKRVEEKASPEHKPPTRKPRFEEEKEEEPAAKRKRFADSLPADEDDEDGEFVL